jgi:hypothetical protein
LQLLSDALAGRAHDIRFFIRSALSAQHASHDDAAKDGKPQRKILLLAKKLFRYQVNVFYYKCHCRVRRPRQTRLCC